MSSHHPIYRLEYDFMPSEINNFLNESFSKTLVIKLIDYISKEIQSSDLTSDILFIVQSKLD